MMNFKHILTITIILTCLMQACQQGPDYKQVRDEVIDLHDKLMADDEKVMNNKIKLDSLVTPASLQKIKAANTDEDTATLHREVDSLRNAAVAIADRMSDWMRNFKPETDGKSNSEAVQYFEAEKTKVKQLDSTYRLLLDRSDNYLKKFGIKTDTTMAGHHHKM